MADAPPHGQVTRQISATRPSGREDSICWFVPPHEAQGSIAGISLSLSDMTPSFTRLAASKRTPSGDLPCPRGAVGIHGVQGDWAVALARRKHCWEKHGARPPTVRRRAVKCRGQVRIPHIAGICTGEERKNVPEPEVVSSPPGPGSVRLHQGKGRWPWPVAMRCGLSFYR